MKKILLFALAAAFGLPSYGQNIRIDIDASRPGPVISRHIYGHFAEHLGSCIYGGLWVGPDSPIPNKQGYRTDVLNALKELKIPNLRWPGGCFADEYHWMDGIGPRENRPKMVNNNWGGVVEDNSFGTHEFLNLCELLECEPYVNGNVGSGTVEEMAKWVEYMTSAGDSPMANLRRQNGREEPWKVRFFGVGNESWGCGGSMRPEYYSDLYRRYATYCREFDGNKLYKIACGASDYDFNWTEVLMKQVGRRMNGLSLHYYTVTGWNGSKGSATDFTRDEYFWIIGKCLEIEEVLKRHMDIMDRYDADKRVGLIVDEWGTWFDVEPGTNPGFLFQQNTLRDAFVAALTLNIFNKYGDRIQMANIAQVVNVLQSMILTRDDQMVLTPSYHVFAMYRNHQDARNLPLTLQSDTRIIREREVPTVSASASTKEGRVFITLANIDPEEDREITLNLPGFRVNKFSGSILTAEEVNTHNTFENPDLVKPVEFTEVSLKGEEVSLRLPAKSILAIELQ